MAETVADIVKILFTAEGVPAVSKAFESVEARMVKFEKSASQQATRGVRERVKAADTERKERTAVYASLFKQIDDKEKAAAKIVDKMSREKVQSEVKAARERLRSEENLARSRQRILENSANMAGRIAERQAAAEIRAAERVGRERSRLAQRAGNGFGGMVMGSAGRVMGGAAMLAGSALAIGGGFGFADSIRGELSFEKTVALASNAAFVEGDAKRTRKAADPARIAGLARRVQVSTNIDKTEAARAIYDYVNHASDLEGLAAVNSDTGRSNLEELARMSKGSGASFEDTINTAAALKANNADMSNGDMMETMRSIIGGGKKGNIPMADLAKYAGAVTSSASRFTGDVTQNQRSLLGLAQLIGPKVNADAAEAATSISHLSSDFMRHGTEHGMTAKMLYEGGDSRKGLLDPSELMANLFKVTGGRSDKAQKILGERSIHMFDALQSTYRDAEASEKGSGVGAVRSKVLDFENTSYSKKAVDEDVERVLQTKAEKLDAAMNQVREILADKGVPIFVRFIDKLSDSMPQIERFIDQVASAAEWFASNPFAGLGLLVTAGVAKDLAAAGIGAAVRAAMVQAASGIMTGAANPGALLPRGVGMSGGGGAVGASAGLGIVGLAAAAALDAKGGWDASLSAKDRGRNEAYGAATNLANVRRALAAGQTTPEEAKKAIENAQALVEKGHSSGLVDIGVAARPLGRTLDKVGSAIGLGDSVTGTTAAQERIGEGAGIKQGEKAIVDAIKQLQAAMQSGGAIASNKPDPAKSAQQPQ